MEKSTTIYVDHPYNKVLTSIFTYVDGWFLGDPGASYEFLVENIKLRASRVLRPDLPQDSTVGYGFYVDLIEIVNRADHVFVDSRITVDVFRIGIGRLASIELILDIAETNVRRASDIVEANFGLLEKVVDPGEMTSYVLGTNGLSWRGVDRFEHPSLVIEGKNDGVSAHWYDDEALAILDEIVTRGGICLDVGCGFKADPLRNMIYYELFDYPSTLVSGFAEKLPFRDHSFDFVYCSAVLEHVRNPFVVSKELLRVLKPGGYLYSGVPFLQPEHGYPSHYFNATREGHKQLFGDAIEIKSHDIPEHCWGLTTVARVLDLYRYYLPPAEQQKWLSTTVGEIIQPEFLFEKSGSLRNISDEGNWVLSYGTRLIARKKA